MQTNFWDSWPQLPENFHLFEVSSASSSRFGWARSVKDAKNGKDICYLICYLYSNSMNLKSNIQKAGYFKINHWIHWSLDSWMSNKIERQVFSKILPMVLETFVQPKGPFLNMQSFPSLHYQQQYSTKDVKRNLCCFSGKLAMQTWTCIYDRTIQEYGQAFDYTLTLPWRPKPRETTAT